MAGQRTQFWKQLWSAKVVLDFAAAIPGDVLPHCRELCIYAVFGAGTTAGTVVVEGSHDPDYTGAWVNIGTMAWSAASTVKKTSITGVHRAVRVRISVAIVNGSCDAYAIGN